VSRDVEGQEGRSSVDRGFIGGSMCPMASITSKVKGKGAGTGKMVGYEGEGQGGWERKSFSEREEAFLVGRRSWDSRSS